MCKGWVRLRSFGRFLTVAALVAGTTLAWARQDRIPGSRYISARGAALGDAFLPWGDDGAAALFYNPANFGKLKGTHLEPINVTGSFNEGFITQFGVDSYKVTSLNSYAPTLQGKPGTFGGVGGAWTPAFFTRGIGFGVMLQSQVGAQANADGTIRYRSLYRLVPTIGTGIRLADGIVRLGYSLQWVNQASGDVTANPQSDALGYSERLKEGSAFSHTVGAALTFPFAYLPSINVVARNVLGTKFSGTSILPIAKNAAGTPDEEKMSLDASVSVAPRLGGSNFLRYSLVLRDALNSSNFSIFARLATGVEVDLRSRFFFRLGYGSGYPAAGFGIRSKTSEFSLAWFSEEVGQSLHSVRDLKFMIQYQVRAF